MGYEELSHTADVALRAWGNSLSELFREAAAGMAAVMGATEGGRVERRVELEAPDVETLLVDWLSELLYLGEVHGETYGAFSVCVHEGPRLEGTVHGSPGEPRGAHIKAVTYHGLSVQYSDGEYSATVVFDT